MGLRFAGSLVVSRGLVVGGRVTTAAGYGELVAVREGSALHGCRRCLKVMVGAQGLVIRSVVVVAVVSLSASSCLAACARRLLLSSMVMCVMVRPAVCGMLALFSSFHGTVTQVWSVGGLSVSGCLGAVDAPLTVAAVACVACGGAVSARELPGVRQVALMVARVGDHDAGHLLVAVGVLVLLVVVVGSGRCPGRWAMALH